MFLTHVACAANTMMPMSCLSAGAQQVVQIRYGHKHVFLSLGGHAAGSEVAKQMVDVYLSTRWEGETNERHASRVVLPPTPHFPSFMWRSSFCSAVATIAFFVWTLFCFCLSHKLIFRVQRKIHELEKTSE